LPSPDSAAAVNADKRGQNCFGIAGGTNFLEAGDLRITHGVVVDIENIDRVLLGQLVLVDADDDILAGVDRACLSAAQVSICILAQPDSTALVMPPIASISSMMPQALSAMSWVSFSIM
jgi:hypothetical protein